VGPVKPTPRPKKQSFNLKPERPKKPARVKKPAGPPSGEGQLIDYLESWRRINFPKG